MKKSKISAFLLSPFSLTLAAGLTAVAAANCSGDTTNATPSGDSGVPQSETNPAGETSPPAETTDEAAPAGSDGPTTGPNPNVHKTGDAANGQKVFRFETFGNEGFWTDAAKLPAGLLAAKFTPVMALKAGYQVDIDALDAATKAALAAELKTDLSPANAPKLNDVNTTVALLNANAIMGVVVVDTNADGKLDIASGDKVGLSCALCHSISDNSVFDLAKGGPSGGSIGKRVDGPAAHNINIGATLALAANSRAFFPNLQLKGADGKSIGRAPSDKGLTKDSTEAEVDAYLSNPAFYPVGMFDDTVDGFGNPMHNTPLFRTDLAAPWGSAGEIQFLDQFSNTVYTILFDLTNLTTPGGKAFLHKVAGVAGDKLAADYASVLAATGVTGPFVKGTTTTMPGDPNGFVGIRVDDKKLIDMSAYLNKLEAPKGATVDAAASARGRAIFRSTGGCTSCHNVDQSKFVPPNVIEMSTIFPGDSPTVLLPRDPPASPIEDTPGNTFDDKMIVINASLRGLKRGSALPLLLDLARKPVFLHDNSVPSMDNLLDPARGSKAPHPFYVADPAARADVVTFLKGLDTNRK
ncbi:MAG: hypothetical protein NVSMB1_11820 [Polyangiales bacterium]